MATAEDVRRAVAVSFPEAERPMVRAALRGYQFGREAARVRLAILALADGDRGEVERLVAAADADYRDVLYWAEYPEESGPEPSGRWPRDTAGSGSRCRRTWREMAAGTSGRGCAGTPD